jgi:dihydromonapterin reductase / dihydrofolate reductase
MNNAILITGAGRRVGFYCAQQLASQGHSVIITYRTRYDSIDLLEAMGVKCIQVDFYRKDAVSSLIQQVQSTTQSLRAIIHNASEWIEDDYQNLAATMESAMMIHASVPYQLNIGLRALLDASADGADIIHITDFIIERGTSKHIAYAASKAALSGLTISFAKTFAPKIKVNEIAPSLLMFYPDDDEDYKQQTLEKSIMGNEPGAAEVLNAIEMILKSSYMTGRTIKLDGGRHLK